MEFNEIVTSAAVFAGTALAAYFGYFRKVTPPPVDPVITGVGMELGNRQQMDMLITEVRGCRMALEAIADRKRSEMQETLEDIVERLKAPRHR